MIKDLFDSNKGIFLMSIGFIILLYSLGIINKKFIMFLVAVGMIVIGFIEFGGVDRVKLILKKKQD